MLQIKTINKLPVLLFVVFNFKQSHFHSELKKYCYVTFYT